MPALQVRDFPEELYDQLKALAARNHRSIAQQTVACVEQMILQENAEENARERGFRVVAGGRRGGARTADSIYAPRFDTEAERAARLEKRKALFKEMEKLPWKGPRPSEDEIVRIIREGREERERTILESLGFYEEMAYEVGEQR